MAKDKRVKEEIRFEPVPLTSPEMAVVERMVAQVVDLFRLRHNETELPIIA